MVLTKFSKSICKKIFFIKTFNSLQNKKALVFASDSYIPSCFHNFTVKIHKGNIFRLLNIDKFNIGLRFSDFIFTRKPHAFIKKKKKSSNIIKR